MINLKKDFQGINVPNYHEISHISWFIAEWGCYVAEFCIEKIDYKKFQEKMQDLNEKILFYRTIPPNSIMKLAIVEKDNLEWGYFVATHNEEESGHDLVPYPADPAYFSIVCPINNKNQIEEKIVKVLKEGCIIPKRKEKSFKMITRNMHGLHLNDGPIPVCNIDLALNYGDDFIAKDSIVEEFIASNESGIMLFHGEPGTGKSFYLKHLVQKSLRDIIFLPNQMIDALTTPDFAEFMLKQKNKTLLIEDAEDVLLDRKVNRFSAAVSNILNLTDGLLGDAIKLKIICTFNMDIHDVDKAVLRKGRLKLVHQFKSLNVKDSNRLLGHLKKDFITEEPMTLANIYNFGTDNGSEEMPEKPHLGFGS